MGLLAGGLSGLFGVGGGVLIVPGLVLLEGMEQRRAHGTSLAAILPIAIAGATGYGVEGALDWAAAALIAVGSAVGAILGTRALRRLPHTALRRGFGVFLLVSAVALLVHLTEGTQRGPLLPWMVAALVLVGIAAGLLAGLLGVGGGIVMIPSLILLLGVPDPVAKGTSLLVIIPTALVGTWKNARYGNVDLPIAGVVGAAGVASALAAAFLAVRLEPTLSHILFAMLLVGVALPMLRPRRG